MVVAIQVIKESRLKLTCLLQTVKAKIRQIMRIFQACVLFNCSNENKYNPDMRAYLQF